MKNKTELHTLITDNITTNSNGDITAVKVREILNETVDSYVHLDDKDATGGVPGLTLFKINFRNVANTFTSFFTNSNTAARTYTFQNRNGTIADDTDLAIKVDGNTAIAAGTGQRVTYDAKGLILSSENCNVQTVTSSATVTAVSTNDLVNITAQAVGLTLANPTGTFYNGQILNYRIEDNGTNRAITFGSKFKGFGSALPTTTTTGKKLLLSCQYDSVVDEFETLNALEQ